MTPADPPSPDYLSALAGHHDLALKALKREIGHAHKKEKKEAWQALRENVRQKERADLKLSLLEELAEVVPPELVKLISDLRTDEIRAMLIDPDSDPDTKMVLQAILDTKEQ